LGRIEVQTARFDRQAASLFCSPTGL